MRRSANPTELLADPRFHDLSGMFAQNEDLIFIDYCHTTESANERVAAAIAGDAIKLMTPNAGPVPGGGPPSRAIR